MGETGSRKPVQATSSTPLACSCILLRPLFHIFFFFVFLGLHLRHMEVPRLGVKSEL